MKDKPLVIFITLLGGAVSSICCILKGVGLLWTLFITLVTLIVFMIIGLIVNKLMTEVRNEVAEKERLEAKRAEDERRELELQAMEAIERGGKSSDEQPQEDEESEGDADSQSTDNTASEEGV